MAEKTKEEAPVEYTKYEMARMIGARALQISMGAPFMVKLDEDDLKRLKYNPIEIAKLEFEKNTIPIAIKKEAVAKETGK
jgi:DNA-directed RNA polymerase subunit K